MAVEDRPPLCSIVFLFTFGDGSQEALVKTYPNDAYVRHLRQLLEQEGPVPLEQQATS